MEFSPRKPTSSRKYCYVPGCKSSAKDNRTIRFHRFPKKGERPVVIQNKLGDNMLCSRLVAWKRALKMNKINAYMTICSLHFKSSDYKSDRNVKDKLKRYLKRNAVPSCYLLN